MATLEEVMLDSDYIAELRANNPILLQFLIDEDRTIQMVDYIIVEANFRDSPSRFFQLPFLACQSMCLAEKTLEKLLFSNNSLNNEVQCNTKFWLKLFSFFKSQNPFYLKTVEDDRRYLSTTLASYVSEITIFWMNRQQNALVEFLL